MGVVLPTLLLLLQAAHCVDELEHRGGEISAFFGATIPKNSKVVRKVIDYEINPRYNPMKGICNLAVVFLDAKVPLRANIMKIPLTEQQPPVNLFGFAVGWGRQNVFYRPKKLPDKPIWRSLKATKQRIITTADCSRFAEYKISPQSLCSVPKFGHYYMDDAGSGFVLKKPLRLVGVLSFVANGASVHTGVANFRDWILKTGDLLYQRNEPMPSQKHTG